MKNECLRLLGIGKNSRKQNKSESEDKQIKEDLAFEMLFTSIDMAVLARVMEYFSYFDNDMKEKSRQLYGAAAILEQWASELEENNKSNEDVVNKKLSAAAKVGFSTSEFINGLKSVFGVVR